MPYWCPVWGAPTWWPETSKNIWSLPWLFQSLSSLCWTFTRWHELFYYMLADQTSIKHEANRCFHVCDVFRAAILLSRTAQKSKIQTALFSKQRMLSCWKQASWWKFIFSFMWWRWKPKIVFSYEFQFFMASCENQGYKLRGINY